MLMIHMKCQASYFLGKKKRMFSAITVDDTRRLIFKIYNKYIIITVT